MEKVVTGASDWRSEEEKEKSYLRTAAMSLFKTWIPEHPEAAAERDQVGGLLRQAMGHRDRLTFVSALSTGVDDILVHEFVDQALSMQEILVQREGTEAFLDPRNALRVVRRKYGMMTLITRMTGTMEHRNIVAISLAAGFDQRQLSEFSRLVAARIADSAAEEEQTFRKALVKAQLTSFEVLFHSDVVGRRIPVPWEVKHIFALAGRAARAPGVDPTLATRRVTQPAAIRLTAKALKQLALYARELTSELDIPGADPAQDLLAAAHEDRLLIATRSLFDEYQEARRTALHQRAMGQGTGITETLLTENADFLRDAEAAPGADEEMIRQARALDRIRTLRGRDFFARISMVSGDMDFEGAIRAGSGFEAVERTIATLDPLEGLKAARRIVEPFFRAKAMGQAAASLMEMGREDDAAAAANEATAAALQCAGGDVGPAYAAALQALLVARQADAAAGMLQKAIEYAHSIKELDERVNALMQIVSTLMEAGALPPAVKTNLSRHILGKDVHFWGKPNINSALVEAVVSLLPGADDDTQIFLQKVVAHPVTDVRRSVIRTMPLGEVPALRNMLLSHLKDKDPAVRTEVMERIGWAGDRTMTVYMVNHARHAQESAVTPEEKRALALNLARLDGERQLPFFNAFLGHLATEGAGLTDKQKPYKDDREWQLAGLEVLYHLNSRNARRLIFSAYERAQKRKAPLAELFGRAWTAVKSRPYGDPTLPRSPHDPTWTDADKFDLVEVLARAVPVPEAPEEAPAAEVPAEEKSAARPVSTFTPAKEGLFSRLKKKLFRGDDDDEPASSVFRNRPDIGTHESVVDSETLAPATDEAAAATPEPQAPTVSPAALRFEGMLLEGAHPVRASLPMVFALYGSEDAPTPLWQESHAEVPVAAGAFNVQLGLEKRLPAPIPNIVWLGVRVQDRPEMRPRAKLSRARSVVQG